MTSAVAARDFVSWAASKGDARGRVKSVHKGKVPAVPVKLEGTDLDPAARVEMYAEQDGGWVPTGNYLAVSSSKLTKIDDLPAPSSTTEAVASGSFDETRRRVQAAIEDKLEDQAENAGGKLDDGVYVWVCDIGPDWAVYNAGPGDDQYRVSYSIGGDGAVTLGDPVEVLAVTTYQPVEDGTLADAGATEGTEKRTARIAGKLLEAKGVDGDGGRIFGVQIIAVGDSKNGNRYTQPVLEAAAPLYEGAKAFDHHRTEAELRSSTITGLIGSYRDVEATSEGLFADLHLLPSAKHTAEALDASLAAQEQGLQPLVGISHDVEGMWRPVVEGNRRLREATQILSVNSADVVADPAAGGRATRMVAGGIDTREGKEPTVDETELIAALKSLTPERAGELGISYKPADDGDGAGDGDGGAATEAVVAGLGAGAQVFERDGVLGRLAIEHALKSAQLPQKVTEAVVGMFPEKFSEAQLPAHVATIKNLIVGLEKGGLVPTIASAEVVAESLDKKVKMLEATFNGDFANGFSSFKQAWAAFAEPSSRVRLDTEDINRRILSESFGGGYHSSQRTTESVAASTWSAALGDSITRRMVAEYQQPSLSGWKQIVSSTPPVNDFRTQRIERLGGYGVLPIVNEGAPYQPLTTPTNEEATYALNKKGGTEDLTLEAVANDDLRLVVRIPQKLGLAAAQTLFRFVFDLLATNPTCTYDSTLLFAAGHNNADAGNTLSQSNLSVGRKRMRKQTAYGDSTDILSIVPKTLVVPSSLEELAFQLSRSAVAVPATPAGPSNTPNIHQNLDYVVVDYFDASASGTWYLVADPAMTPTIEVGFYQGRQDPELFSQTDATVGSVFTADKITYKIRHIYSGTVLDHRGFYRGN